MLHNLFAVSLMTIALLAVPVSAHEDESVEAFDIECNVAYGTGIPGVGTAGFTLLDNSFGSCTLGVVEETVAVHEIDAAAGCSIEFDANGDNFSEGEVVFEDTYDAGTQFMAFCDVGVINADNLLTLHPVVEEA